jgi:hypothetical protein
MKWIFIIVAYSLEIIASFIPMPRTESNTQNLLTLVQYVMAGVMGYLFGQSGSK